MIKIFMALMLSVAGLVAFGQESKTSAVVVHDMNDARECVDRIRLNLESRRGFENGLPLSKIASKSTGDILIEFEGFWKLESNLELWGKRCAAYPTFSRTLGFAKEENTVSPEVEAKAKLLYEEMRTASLSAKPSEKQREMRDFFYEIIMKRGEDHAKEVRKLAKERAHLSDKLRDNSVRIIEVASDIFTVQTKMVRTQEKILDIRVILEVYPDRDLKDGHMKSGVLRKTKEVWNILGEVAKLRLPSHSQMSAISSKVGHKEAVRLIGIE